MTATVRLPVTRRRPHSPRNFHRHPECPPCCMPRAIGYRQRTGGLDWKTNASAHLDAHGGEKPCLALRQFDAMARTRRAGAEELRLAVDEFCRGHDLLGIAMPRL